MTNFIKSYCNLAERSKNLIIFWTRGHARIKSNEIVDKLAKAGGNEEKSNQFKLQV